MNTSEYGGINLKVELNGKNDRKLEIETFPDIGGDSVSLGVRDGAVRTGISIDKEQFFAVVELLKLEKVEKRR